MIKIYTDTNYLKPSKELLFPLLDEFILNPDTPLKNYYTFVEDYDDCDIILLPVVIDYLLQNGGAETVKDYKQKAIQHNKPLWVFASGDLGLTIKEPNVYVFRLADFESVRLKTSIIMPPFVNDPLGSVHNPEISFLPHSDTPVIGYVGHAKSGIIKYLRAYYIYLKYNWEVFRGKIHSDYYRMYSPSHVRIKYLRILQKAEKVRANFIFRDKYRAGIKGNPEKDKTTFEFFENIRNSHYTFCMRGGGNFSLRLYETLAMGRIPLQINTDCSLPLEAYIDWNKHCLIVDEKNIADVENELLRFNSKFNDEEFIDLQRSNRLFWEKYLTRPGYFTAIHDLFIQNKL